MMRNAQQELMPSSTACLRLLHAWGCARSSTAACTSPPQIPHVLLQVLACIAGLYASMLAASMFATSMLAGLLASGTSTMSTSPDASAACAHACDGSGRLGRQGRCEVLSDAYARQQKGTHMTPLRAADTPAPPPPPTPAALRAALWLSTLLPPCPFLHPP